MQQNRRKTTLEELPGISTHKAPLGNLLLGSKTTHWMLMRFPSTQKWCVSWVCSEFRLQLLPWRAESGSAVGAVQAAGRCGHTRGWSPCHRPGQQLSHPTENTHTHINTLFISDCWYQYSSRMHELIAATQRQTQRQMKSSLSTAAHYRTPAIKQQNTLTFHCRQQERLPKQQPLTRDPGDCSYTDNGRVTTVQNTVSLWCETIAPSGRHSKACSSIRSDISNRSVHYALFRL